MRGDLPATEDAPVRVNSPAGGCPFLSAFTPRLRPRREVVPRRSTALRFLPPIRGSSNPSPFPHRCRARGDFYPFGSAPCCLMSLIRGCAFPPPSGRIRNYEVSLRLPNRQTPWNARQKDFIDSWFRNEKWSVSRPHEKNCEGPEAKSSGERWTALNADHPSGLLPPNATPKRRLA